jgi:hypothetical protein
MLEEMPPSAPPLANSFTRPVFAIQGVYRTGRGKPSTAAAKLKRAFRL